MRLCFPRDPVRRPDGTVSIRDRNDAMYEQSMPRRRPHVTLRATAQHERDCFEAVSWKEMRLEHLMLPRR